MYNQNEHFGYNFKFNFKIVQVSWSNEMVQRMNAAELAKDVPEAESMLQIHHERKVCILTHLI